MQRDKATAKESGLWVRKEVPASARGPPLSREQADIQTGERELGRRRRINEDVVPSMYEGGIEASGEETSVYSQGWMPKL